MRQQTIDLLLAHERLVISIAQKFHETTGFDADELVSFGRSTLIAQAKKWDPARGKFSTFLYWLLRSSFIDYIHKQRKEVFVEVYEEAIEAPESYSPLPTRMQELLNSVSDDGIEMIEIIIASRWTDAWQNLSKCLHRTMIKRGWTESRFSAAFDEIQQQVKAW